MNLKYVGVRPLLNKDGSFFFPNFGKEQAMFLCDYCGKIYSEQGAKCACLARVAFNETPGHLKEKFHRDNQRFFPVMLSRRRFVVFTSEKDSRMAEVLPKSFLELYEATLETEHHNVQLALQERARITQAEREKEYQGEREAGQKYLQDAKVIDLITEAFDSLQDLMDEESNGDWTIRPGVNVSDVINKLKAGQVNEKFFGFAENPVYSHQFVWNGPARDTQEEALADIASHKNEFPESLLSYVVMRGEARPKMRQTN